MRYINLHFTYLLTCTYLPPVHPFASVEIKSWLRPCQCTVIFTRASLLAYPNLVRIHSIIYRLRITPIHQYTSFFVYKFTFKVDRPRAHDVICSNVIFVYDVIVISLSPCSAFLFSRCGHIMLFCVYLLTLFCAHTHLTMRSFYRYKT